MTIGTIDRERSGRRERNMLENRFLKRLSKKARKGLRGWPIATIAFYGPNLSQATKVAVGTVPSENAEVEELRDWKVERSDIRADSAIAREILEFIEQHQVRSVAMSDGIIGCPHQEGIDYEGEWCPVCEFWHGRDRFTGRGLINVAENRLLKVCPSHFLRIVHPAGICSPAGRSAFSLATASCVATAHCTASTVLAKSARMLSPAVVNMRPRWAAIRRSMTTRYAVRVRRVPTSS